MTTQITKIAMFAIAAFALGGMVFAPAYANGAISKDITMVSGQNVIPWSDIGCGSGDQCKMKAAAIAGFSSDNWTVWFGPTGNTTCDVFVSVVGENGWNESSTFLNLSSEVSTVFTGPADIDVGDEYTVTASYTSCS